MATTPQTNSTLKDIAAAMLEHDNFVICGHVSPDGDCIGSQLALMHALRSAGKQARCVLAETDAVLDPALSFLPGFDELTPPAKVGGEVEVFVGVDVPTIERIADAAALHDAADLCITIDHHAVDTTMAQLVYVDPDSASTTLLIWELAGNLTACREPAVAQCCYTGLVTDTGRFQYQNTTAACFDAAAQMISAGADPAFVAREVFQNRSLPSVRLGSLAVERMRFASEGRVVLSWLTSEDFERLHATKADAEPVVDTLRGVRGVQVACILREQGESIRGSLRAKDDTDVSVIARAYGGGGHKAAAGFTLQEPIEQAKERVLRDLQELVGGSFAPAPSKERAQ